MVLPLNATQFGQIVGEGNLGRPAGQPVGFGSTVPPFMQAAGGPIGGPLTGLRGSEQVLRRAGVGAGAQLLTAQDLARGDINLGTQNALDLLSGTRQDIAGQFQQGQNILTGAGQDIAGQFQQGQNLLTGAGQDIAGQFQQGQNLLTGAGQDISGLFNQAVDPIQQFIGQGANAQQLQAALSGAQGQGAFDQALLASPAQQFIQEQGELSRLRGASATGGLGGGNIQKELTRFGQGLASTRLQEQINNLAGLSGQGLQAASTAGQLRGVEGGITSGLARTGADLTGRQAGITSDIGRTGADLTGRQAGITGQLGTAGAGLTGEQARLAGTLGTTGAGITQRGGFDLANVATGTGRDLAQATLGTGRALATGRTVAGQDIAGAIGTTTSALSNLASQQGAGVGDLLSGGNLANILAGAGSAQGLSQEQLATILANIATGSASQVAGLPGIPGVQQTEGILEGVGQAAGGIGTAALAFSDRLLKENITHIGTLESGHKLYTWNWNAEGRKIAPNQVTVGVIAQEAKQIDPDAVMTGEHGYLAVDYSRIH